MTSIAHNVGGWPRRWAERRPDALAVVDEHRRLDWRSFEQRVAQAAGLLRDANVEAGDRIGLLLGNHSTTLELVLATARIGAIAVPINTRLAPPELAFLLDDCRPRALFFEADIFDALSPALELARSVPDLCVAMGEGDYQRRIEAARADPRIEAVDADDPMILMYTSGTTGHPKGALLPHRKTLYNCLNAQLYFGLRSHDRVLVAAPLFHSLGLKILSLPAIYAGAAVFLHPRFDSAHFCSCVEGEGITYSGGVPTMYRHLLGHLERAGASEDLSSLRFLFTAGAAIPVEVVAAYQGRGLCLKQGYGQTETSILTCLDEADALPKAGSVGRAVFHSDLRLVDPATVDGPVSQWRDAGPEQAGEIVVRGPTLMVGYWERPEESAETLRPEGWLRTGDLARRDAEGFYTLAGRRRELYISGGENVYPAEVEAVYAGHADVREIAVVGVPDDEWGEVGRAFVVPEGRVALDPQELRRWGRERLAAFKLPRDFVMATALPRTASGKVQKHRLSQAEPDLPAAPRSQSESR